MSTTCNGLMLRFIVLSCALSLAVGVAAHAAEQSPRLGTSLDLVPADAAFYASSMRMKEKLDIVTSSNAWKQLMGTPLLQAYKPMLQHSWREAIAAYLPEELIQTFWLDPESRELWALLGDALSSEVFIYAGGDLIELIGVKRDLARAGSPPFQLGDAPAPEQRNAKQRGWLRAAVKNRDRLTIPSIVMGCKVADADRAQRQIDRLATQLTKVLDRHPLWKSRLTRIEADDEPYLQLTLNGGMIPWDKTQPALGVPIEGSARDFDAIRETVRGMNLVITLGIRRGYLLYTIGSSAMPRERFGSSPPLAGHPRLRPLRQHAPARLTRVVYVSDELLNASAMAAPTAKDAASLLGAWLTDEPLSQLTTQQAEAIRSDLRELADDLSGPVRKRGARLVFNFITPHGIEGYRYDWSDHPRLDGSRPLALLRHLDGDPIMAYVFRLKYKAGGFELVRKWGMRLLARIEEMLVPALNDHDRQIYDQMAKALLPLYIDFDRTTRKSFLPALRDGEWALLVDAKGTAEQWFAEPDAPDDDRRLPMPQPAVLMGVSDADLLRKACGQYRDALNAFIDALRKFDSENGDISPDFELPAPESRTIKVENGTAEIYWYPAWAGFGLTVMPDAEQLHNQQVDELLAGEKKAIKISPLSVYTQILPNLGLSDHVAAFTLFTPQTERLLSPSLLAVSPASPLADPDQALASAFYFDFAGLIDAVVPWIGRQIEASSGVDYFADDATAEGIEADKQKLISQTMGAVVGLIKTIRGVQSATYFEDDALVTHSLIEIRDTD